VDANSATPSGPRKRISREKLGVHVYMAYQKGRRKNQQLRRLDLQGELAVATSPLRETLSQELNAAIVLFYSLLDEQQRRLYAGLESFKLGHGGDRKIAKCLGLDVHTVARGRRELFGGQVEWEGVRSRERPTGRKTPEVTNRSRSCWNDTAGDPITGRKWTRRTTRKIAKQLKRLGITVSPRQWHGSLQHEVSYG
jgi:hypothetical protein